MTMDEAAPLPLQEGSPRPLAHYRIVELPGPVSLGAGKAFADLGADLIKVEPPGGDPARLLPPLAHGEHGAASLYWDAYSLGKRSITADLDTDEGRAAVRRLAATADVVIEAYAPGTLDAMGLGYDVLSADNPGLVLASLTPFGQTGPYAQWKGSDLVHFAMSNYLHMTGPKGDTPIKPTVPYQTWLFGSMHAVVATMIALRGRKRTGRGTHIDEAIRDTGIWMLSNTYQTYDMLGLNLQRYGAQRDIGGAVRLPNVFHCSDGYVIWLFQSGQRGKDTAVLVDWMHENGMAPEWLREQDWETFDLLEVPPDVPERMAVVFGDFFKTKTKSELLEWAVGHGVMMAPVQSLADLLKDRQLAARETWRSIELEGQEVVVPGPPIRMGEGAWEPRGGPPAPGAHSDEVYLSIGMTHEEIAGLRRAGAI